MLEDEVGEVYRFGVHLWKRFGCWVETLETLKEKFLLGVLILFLPKQFSSNGGGDM